MRRSTSFCALTLCAVALTATAARADSTGTTFIFGPGFGPTGTVVTFRGTGCVADQQVYDYMAIDLYAPGDKADAHAVLDRHYPVKPDGSFGGTLKTPALAPGLYDFVARCFRAGQPLQLVKSSFLVQAGTASPAPTANPHPATTTTTAPSRTPAARSASPKPAGTTPPRSAPPQATGAHPTTPATVAAGSSRPASRTPLAVVAILLAAAVGSAVVSSYRAVAASA